MSVSYGGRKNEELFKPQFGCVCFANCCHEAELYQAANYSGRDVWAVRIVTEILGKFFFTSVWSREACLDPYPGHGKT